MSIRGPKSNIKVAILGPGAIGGLIAVLLKKRGYFVVCVARPTAVAPLKENGLRLQSEQFGNVTSYPDVVTDLDFPVDVVFITTKAPALVEALPTIVKGVSETTVIVPLLNGVEHVDVLHDLFGNNVLVGTIGGLVAERVSAHEIRVRGTDSHINLSQDGFRAEEVHTILTDIGIDSRLFATETEVIWSKFVRLAVIASLTAAAGNKTLGEIRADPLWRGILMKILEEVAAIANREGFGVKSHEVLRQIDALPSGLTTSLQRDIQEGKSSEVDSLVGALIRKARTYNLPHTSLDYALSLIMQRIEIEK